MNATVTLPIGDLDNLRNEKKELEEKVKFYEKHQKEVKLTVREHYFGQEYVGERLGYRLGYYQMVDRYIEKEPQYINFEDVRAELKKEEESKVIEKLGKLEREVVSLKSKIEEEKTKHSKLILELDKVKQEELKSYIDKAKEKEDALNLEIKKLKGEIIDLDKDEQIEQLKNQISELKQKTFFQRLFNI